MKSSEKDHLIFIDSMLESIALIRQYAEDISKSDFEHTPEKQDAIIRRIELLGEAAKRIPSAVRGLCPDVPWKEISGMRDKLVHDYLGIDLDMVWQVTRRDLEPLERNLLVLKEKYVTKKRT